MKEKKGLVKRILVSVLAVALMVCCFPAPAVRAEGDTYQYHLEYYTYNSYWREAVCYSFDVESDSRIALIYDYSDNGVIDIYGNIGERNFYRLYGIYSLPGRATTTNISGDVIDQRAFTLYGSFCGIDMVTDIPAFATQEEADRYIQTGDKTGNLLEDQLLEYRVGIVNLNYWSMAGIHSFSWYCVGLLMENGNYMKYPVLEDSYLKVSLGYALRSDPDNIVSEIYINEKYDFEFPFINDRAVKYSKIINKTDDSTLFLRYIKFLPVFRCAPESGDSYMGWMVGLPSYVYFTDTGEFSSVEDDKTWFFPDDNVTEDDFLLPDFNTGIDWLDLLLNSFVSMFNAVLKAFYKIRDLIYAKNGTGLLNLLHRILFSMPTLGGLTDSFFRFIRSDIFGIPYAIEKSLIEIAFVPSPEYIENLKNAYFAYFPFLGEIVRYKDNVVAVYNGINGVSPTITIPLSRINSHYISGLNDIVVGFEWYEPYREFIKTLISSYLLIRFTISQFFGLKSLITGVSSHMDDIMYFGGE